MLGVGAMIGGMVWGQGKGLWFKLKSAYIVSALVNVKLRHT